MSIFDIDLKKESEQLKEALIEALATVAREEIPPIIRSAKESTDAIVERASTELKESISLISREMNEHRRMTKDEVEALIHTAAQVLGEAIDQRMTRARDDASVFFTEKINALKAEFEDAAIRSRRTLYFNIGISMAAAMSMAIVGLLYKKASLGELDIFSTFRVLAISAGAGSGLYGILKLLRQWSTMSGAKRNIATITLSAAGLIRPNGAAGFFIISVLLFAAWAAMSFGNWS